MAIPKRVLGAACITLFSLALFNISSLHMPSKRGVTLNDKLTEDIFRVATFYEIYNTCPRLMMIFDNSEHYTKAELKDAFESAFSNESSQCKADIKIVNTLENTFIRSTNQRPIATDFLDLWEPFFNKKLTYNDAYNLNQFYKDSLRGVQNCKELRDLVNNSKEIFQLPTLTNRLRITLRRVTSVQCQHSLKFVRNLGIKYNVTNALRSLDDIAQFFALWYTISNIFQRLSPSPHLQQYYNPYNNMNVASIGNLQTPLSTSDLTRGNTSVPSRPSYIPYGTGYSYGRWIPIPIYDSNH